MARASQRVAVIDVGSNSTRLLIADVADGEVAKLERQSRVTRLGRGVDLTGQLAAEAIEATCEAIGHYAALCERFEVSATATIATSAVRDASNGDAFVAELRERFALTARVLDGAEEARLTYLGATHERAPSEPTLVLDIGGGSTELIVGHGSRIDFEHSMQVGVVRHTERHISGDPPTAAELEGLAADVRGSIEAAVPPEQAERVAAGIAVAGTPTSLAAVELELEPYDPERVHGHVLSLDSIQRLLSVFASRPLPARKEIPGLHEDRAPTIIAGVVILVEVMRAFRLSQIRVAEHDILYGAALQVASRAP
ncbi:MAG TPA: Ppx/GppA phosphatase family protein [Solirubrobacterales bacterium]|nr:Ppx/GppA phosphatase family protein [Solirubrobacterales bacterium]